MNDWYEKAQALLPELQTYRRAFHRAPELGNNEYHTAEKIEEILHRYGIETVRLTKTAVMGVLTGTEDGKCVGLRADMDALPICERTGLPFASENAGVMHACGHDMHMAALLGAARLLCERKDALQGTVKFFFQPDEEGNGGAQRMIEAGCLNTPSVGAVFGAHVSPELPVGSIGIRTGKFYAASNPFQITFLGKSCHGAEPEKGHDALAAAARVVNALLEIPQLLLPERAVVSVGTFQAGSAANIIADRAEISGIIRTLGEADRQRAQQLVRERVEQIAAEFGVEPIIEIRESYPGVVNGEKMTGLLKNAAEQTLGAQNVQMIAQPTMTTEDFGYYIRACDGSFYHVGVGGTQPLHNPAFAPDERALCVAAAVHAAVAWSYLMNE